MAHRCRPSRLRCNRLAAALAHSELVLERVEDDPQRPRLHCRELIRVTHAPFRGFNRAQAAVIECAILVSRLHMLPREKIDAELEYLSIAVSKTAGPRELEAWGWLLERIAQFRAQHQENRGMTAMLASVRTLDEALLALAGGADIIDLKDPARGALGALDQATARNIVAAIGGRAPVSATIGDLPSMVPAETARRGKRRLPPPVSIS